MEINDLRFVSKELKFDDLEAGKVYISSRMLKYMMRTVDLYNVCLVSGDLSCKEDHYGDVFTEVNARLEIY